MDTARHDGPPVFRRLNPQALQEMGSYFGPLDPEKLPSVERLSFWESLVEYNPLGQFGASEAASMIRESTDPHTH